MEMIWTRGGACEILDQTELPAHETVKRIDTVEQMAEAIRRLRVRGAPLIGVSAAYGLAIAARNLPDGEDFLAGMDGAAALLRATRPTAVNLFWAIERVMGEMKAVYAEKGREAAKAALWEIAERMKREDIATNRALGALGAELLADGDGVLTHCNAGALATCGYGTALGVLRAAKERGLTLHVFSDETRPLLQGARLTCWELLRDGFDVTLLADNMAASLMASGRVQKVIVGADRIAANGDAANKIGTYGVALLAKAHGVPFYVAAPTSTIDRTLASGSAIPIEFRDGDEMRFFQGVQSAPLSVKTYNPAFDVTPNALIAGIVTEKGVLRAPYVDSIAKAFQ